MSQAAPNGLEPTVTDSLKNDGKKKKKRRGALIPQLGYKCSVYFLRAAGLNSAQKGR